MEGPVRGDAVEPEGLVRQGEVGLGVEQGVDAGLEVAEHAVGLDGGEDLELGDGVDGAGGPRAGLAGLGREA